MPTVKDDDSSSSSSSIVARVFRSPHTITMLACGGAALGVATQAFSTAGSADAGTTADGLRRGVYGAVNRPLPFFTTTRISTMSTASASQAFEPSLAALRSGDSMNT